MLHRSLFFVLFSGHWEPNQFTRYPPQNVSDVRPFIHFYSSRLVLVCHSYLSCFFFLLCHDSSLLVDPLSLPVTFLLSSCKDWEVVGRFSSAAAWALPVHTMWVCVCAFLYTHSHTPSVRPAPSKQTKIISLTLSHLAYCTWEQSLCSLSHLLHCPCTNTLSCRPVCEHTPR